MHPMMKKLPVLLALLPCLAALSIERTRPKANDHVTVRVAADTAQGAFSTAWNYVGYDEPNYTYAPHGAKLLREFSALSPAPVYVRAHNLLTTGDGSSSLKWGSTNAYTTDASGRPIYNWRLVDRIFDTYKLAHVRPFVEIGFMPEALSTHPKPYRHTFPNGSLWTGWAYPPKDYEMWAELVYQWVRHAVTRYGRAEVETWPWEVWNEPDIGYWQGTREEFFRLYDYSVDAVKRALPTARVGGPDATGGAFDFMQAFMEHCRSGKNYATGKIGAPLEFLSFHPKGAPRFQDGHVRMGLDTQLRLIDRQFAGIESFPEYRNLPVILGESDPEGCAACSAATHPENGYREGPLYGTYTAVALHNILTLAEKHHIRMQGIVTWAFEFEDTPYFAGYRELATNGIDKPVLNVFRMLGKMDLERVALSSDAGISAEDILKNGGVRGKPDINGMATRGNRRISVLLWNYHDDDVPATPAAIDLILNQLPANVKQVTLHHYRMDTTHSNAHQAWLAMGSPALPQPAQYKQLETAGKLQELGKPNVVPVENGVLKQSFALPRQGVSLLQFSW